MLKPLNRKIVLILKSPSRNPVLCLANGKRSGSNGKIPLS